MVVTSQFCSCQCVESHVALTSDKSDEEKPPIIKHLCTILQFIGTHLIHKGNYLCS